MQFRSILKFLMHQLESTIGIAVGCAATVDSIWPAIRGANQHWQAIKASHLLTEIHLFPIQTAAGLLLGFVLYRRFRFRGMFWVWVLPWFILFFVFLNVPISHEQFFAYFFGSACNPKEHCFTQIAVTLPALSSASYALGAALANFAFVSNRSKTSRGLGVATT